MAAPRNPVGPIQRTFAGLLGFLDLKGAEMTPNTMAGVTAPTMDVEKYLLAALYRSKTFTNPALPIIAGSATFALATGAVVPEGKVWLVKAIAANAQMAAGDTLKQFGVSITAGQGTAAVMLSTLVGTWAPAAPASLALATWNTEGALVLPAGAQIGINFSEAVFAAALPFSCDVLFAEVNG